MQEQYGVQMIAPHRSNRARPTQDGRPLRRYRRRWTVERLFAWLQVFRHLVTRYEYHIRRLSSRIRRYTRLAFTVHPRRRNSAVIRGRP